MSPLDIPLALTGISVSILTLAVAVAWIVWSDRREDR